MRRIINWPFFLITLILTGTCFTTLIQHTDGVFAWMLFGVSAIPVYTTIYQGVLFAKAAIFHEKWALQPQMEKPRSTQSPRLAFLIASYQEPFEVAKMTFDCAMNAIYSGPREIIVVDNSISTESGDFRLWKAYVESFVGKNSHMRVVFRHNERRADLKPGNIDLAQTLITDSEYVVFLDVDSSIPAHRKLLDVAVGEFEADSRLGILQFHTVATNDHFNQLTGPVAVLQNAARIQHLIRGSGGFAMFYGHNAMWRRALLDINGPWLEHYRGNVMVTEDLLKTLGAHRHGYTNRYIDVPTGEWIPSSLGALESMWMRWAYGGFQVLFKYIHQIATTKGLRFLERVDLLTFLVSYCANGLFYLVSLLWLLVFPPRRVGLLTFVMIFVPQIICGWVVHRRYTRELSVSPAKKLWYLYSGFSMIHSFVLATGLRAGANFLVGAKQGWQVTSKGLEERPSRLQVIKQNSYIVGLALVILFSLTAAWGGHTGFAIDRLVDYSPLAFFAVNLLLCVFIFGRQGRNSEALIEGTTIDGYQFRNEVLS